MNATPIPSSSTAIAQASSASQKGEPTAVDTPFSQFLSGEIALQTPGDAREPDSAKSLEGRLRELLDAPSEPAQAAADAGLLLAAAPEPGVPPAEASDAALLLAAGFFPVPAPHGAPPTSSDAHAAEALTQDDAAPHVPPAGTALPGATAASTDAKPRGHVNADASTRTNVAKTGLGASPNARTDAGSTLPTMAAAAPDAGAAPSGGEVPGGSFATRPAADGTHVPEVSPGLAGAPLSRPAAPPAAADTGAAPGFAAAPRLAPEVGSTAWGQALGERIVWMASGKQQTASLTLNPPHLGPLQVVLNVSSDQATANFFAAQPDVRHAIEAALPRLREMMNEAGIELGQASVSADTPSQDQAREQEFSETRPHVAGTRAEADAPASPLPAPRPMRGLIDTFA